MNLADKGWRGIARARAARGVSWLALLWLGVLSARAGNGPQATNLWKLSFEDSSPGNFSTCTPAVAPDGTVYAGDFVGKFYAYTPAGDEKWCFKAGREIRSSPAIGDDGAIYFGCRNRRFYALTPAGRLKWKFAADDWIDSSPAIAADGTIYFGSNDNFFYALHPDGTLKWKFNAGGMVDSSPAIGADGTIYFGAHNKNFYALDAAGKMRWSFSTEAEIASSPAIGDDGSIYFNSADGNLYRLKPDGGEVWRCRTGSGAESSPVLADNGNICLTGGMRQLMVSPKGAIVWDFGCPAWVDVAPLAAQGTVCFSMPWHMFLARDSAGAESWSAELTTQLYSSPVISDTGRIYFSGGSFVQGLQPPVQLLAAKSSWPMFRANARHTGRVAGF